MQTMQLFFLCFFFFHKLGKMVHHRSYMCYTQIYNIQTFSYELCLQTLQKKEKRKLYHIWMLAKERSKIKKHSFEKKKKKVPFYETTYILVYLFISKILDSSITISNFGPGLTFLLFLVGLFWIYLL